MLQRLAIRTPAITRWCWLQAQSPPRAAQQGRVLLQGAPLAAPRGAMGNLFSAGRAAAGRGREPAERPGEEDPDLWIVVG